MFNLAIYRKGEACTLPNKLLETVSYTKLREAVKSPSNVKQPIFFSFFLLRIAKKDKKSGMNFD